MSPEMETKRLKLGVEVVGVDLGRQIGDAQLFRRIKAAAHEHRLLVFRQQGELAAQTFIDICGHLGDVCHDPYITQTPVDEIHHKTPAPAIMRISNDANEGYKGPGKRGWHIDGSYRAVPFSFLVFNCVKAPRTGDTKFVGIREVLQSVTSSTFNHWDRISTEIRGTVLGNRVIETHPLVYEHPVTKEPTMCLHLGFTQGAIIDFGTESERWLDDEEKASLKAEITEEIVKDNERLIYSHKWLDGDVVMIDNLQVAHLASPESQRPVDEVGLRILHRIAVNGIQKPSKKTAIGQSH